jgi:hypothetical protein
MTNTNFRLKLLSSALYLRDKMSAKSTFKLNFIQIQSMIYAVNCVDCCLVLVFVYAKSTVAYGMWCQVYPVPPHILLSSACWL